MERSQPWLQPNPASPLHAHSRTPVPQHSSVHRMQHCCVLTHTDLPPERHQQLRIPRFPFLPHATGAHYRFGSSRQVTHRHHVQSVLLGTHPSLSNILQPSPASACAPLRLRAPLAPFLRCFKYPVKPGPSSTTVSNKPVLATKAFCRGFHD